MSEVGQSRNHYHRLRRFSELFDEVLRQNAPEPTMNQLGEVLARIARHDFHQIDEMVLHSLACDSTGINETQIDQLAESLLAGILSEQSRMTLASLSAVLHDESASTLNRLRSGR